MNLHKNFFIASLSFLAVFASQAQTCTQDDFDPSIDMTMWQSITDGTANVACGSVSGNALMFDGATGNTREAITVPQFVPIGGDINFELAIGDGTGSCENADAGEDVVLEYSTDNGNTWVNINTYLESVYTSTFTSITEPIPAAAYSNTTLFRWRQLGHSGTGFDNWAIDDVDIVCIPPNIPPQVDFTADYPTTCTGVVNFTADIFGLVDSVRWYFGDGQTSTTLNPSHSYASFGMYDVTLIAYNGFGTDTMIKLGFVNYINVSLTPVNCTPNTTNYSCCFGIYNVTLNTLNNTTADGQDGYQDNSCFGTSLMEGLWYDLEVTVNSASNENVRAWIDWDDNGQFDPVTELVFSANNVTGTAIDSFFVPGDAVENTELRLRVASDDANQPAPTPCGAPNKGQMEDYFVVVQFNPNPPIAKFGVDEQFICLATVNFFDSSLLVVTGWLWDFGTGDTSHQQNPSYTYTTPGVYTVSLTVSNSNGSDTETKTAYITVSAGPAAPNCQPTTTNYCCGAGITRVSLNTMINISGDGQFGYEDFSCTNGTNLTLGQKYRMDVQTNPDAPETVRAWIDWNNDGDFDPVTELVFKSDTTLMNHTDSVFVPGSAVLGTTLRMRVGSDFHGVPVPAPCNNLVVGQFEDYSIDLLANNQPPIANYMADKLITCTGTVNFTDLSANVPTSWFWEFGDGNTSTFQNPTHTYTASGMYNVTLTVSNAQGNDVKNSMVLEVKLGTTPPAASCEPLTQASNCVGYGIFQFNLESIVHASGCSSSSSKRDYTCEHFTELMEGATYSFTYKGHTTLEQDTKIWVDMDRNGVFHDKNELVFSKNNTKGLAQGTLKIPANRAPIGAPLRMRIMSDLAGNGPAMFPCFPPDFGEYMDVTVELTTNPNPPIARFYTDKTTTCDKAIQFTDDSENSVDDYLWDFGDGTTSTQQSPLHYYLDPGTYTVSLTVSNDFGQDDTTAFFLIQIDSVCTYNMPSAGVKVVKKCSGRLYDSGGPFANYGNNQSGVFTITPLGATSITLDFVSFNVETGADFMFVYDGNNTSAPLLTPQPLTGVTPPPSITSSGGSITIEFISDNDNNGAGWEIEWSCNGPPVAALVYDPSRSNLCEGEYQFLDLSERADSWLWTFSGLEQSTDQHPQFQLTDSLAPDSLLLVSLFASNSISTDSAFELIPIHMTFPHFSWQKANYNVIFKDSSRFGIKNWSWAFGDGDSAFVKNPTHTYAGNNQYNVTLIVDNGKCQNELTRSLNVNVGIEEPSIEQYVSVFPNPALHELNLMFRSYEVEQVSLMNLLGETIFTTNNVSTNMSLDVSQYAAGVYLVSIKTPDGVFAQRVVIAR